MGIEAEIDSSRSEIAENFKDDIICSICCYIFEDPVILDCCGGHLCSKCFQDVRSRFSNCPLCRKAKFTAKQSRLMATVLSKVKLLCPADECRMSVPFEKFEEHKRSCLAWNKKTCPECKKVMSMNKFHEHFVCFEKRMKLKDSTELERKVIAQKREINILLTKNNVNSTKIKKMDGLMSAQVTKVATLMKELARKDRVILEIRNEHKKELLNLENQFHAKTAQQDTLDSLRTKIERQRVAITGLHQCVNRLKDSHQKTLLQHKLATRNLESDLLKSKALLGEEQKKLQKQLQINEDHENKLKIMTSGRSRLLAADQLATERVQEKLTQQSQINADLQDELKKMTYEKNSLLNNARYARLNSVYLESEFEDQKRRIIALEHAEKVGQEQMRKLKEENVLLKDENSKLSAQTPKKGFMSSIFKKCK